MVPTAMIGDPAPKNLRMNAKVSELPSAALLAMLLSCGAAHSDSIPLIHAHGTLQVPVVINGKISLSFTIDSGATDVSIPAIVFSALTRDGTVSPRALKDNCHDQTCGFDRGSRPWH
jgi:hypothetical protein